MKKTIITITSALMLLTAATASAQDSDIEQELEDTSEWTTDVQPSWTQQIVDHWWNDDSDD